MPNAQNDMREDEKERTGLKTIPVRRLFTLTSRVSVIAFYAACQNHDLVTYSDGQKRTSRFRIISSV